MKFLLFMNLKDLRGDKFVSTGIVLRDKMGIGVSGDI
jgi:hypothetical protein